MYQAAAIAAFAKMTIQDSRKIIPPSLYPSWVVFSQQQKLSYITLELLDKSIFIQAAKILNNSDCYRKKPEVSQRVGSTAEPDIIKNDKINSDPIHM